LAPGVVSPTTGRASANFVVRGWCAPSHVDPFPLNSRCSLLLNSPHDHASSSYWSLARGSTHSQSWLAPVRFRVLAPNSWRAAITLVQRMPAWRAAARMSST
jgi:hypothetical protein